MRHSIICAFLLTTLFSFGQKIQKDFYKEVVIQPITHGTLVLQWRDKTVYIDPYGGADGFTGIKPADIIVITHPHGDHYNFDTLSGLDTANATFVVPQSVADEMPESLKKNIVILKNDEEVTLKDINILAVPMYNLPNDDTARHKKGWGNGYVLTINGSRFYVSGDTADIPEMRALKEIDVAFVCMNLPFTMNIEQAASAVLDFKPKIMYPYHYRGRPEVSDINAFKALVDKENQEIEVRLRNWYTE